MICPRPQWNSKLRGTWRPRLADLLVAGACPFSSFAMLLPRRGRAFARSCTALHRVHRTEPPPLRHRDGAGVLTAHLQAHAIGAGGVAGPDPLEHRVLVTPRDDGVDQPVAPTTADVVVGEAEAAEVARVVHELQVDRHVAPGDLPCPVPVGLQDDTLL